MQAVFETKIFVKVLLNIIIREVRVFYAIKLPRFVARRLLKSRQFHITAGVNMEVVLLPTTTFANLTFSESNLDTLRMASLEFSSFLFKLLPQLTTTQGYIEIVHF